MQEEKDDTSNDKLVDLGKRIEDLTDQLHEKNIAKDYLAQLLSISTEQITQFQAQVKEQQDRLNRIGSALSRTSPVPAYKPRTPRGTRRRPTSPEETIDKSLCDRNAIPYSTGRHSASTDASLSARRFTKSEAKLTGSANHRSGSDVDKSQKKVSVSTIHMRSLPSLQRRRHNSGQDMWIASEALYQLKGGNDEGKTKLPSITKLPKL